MSLTPFSSLRSSPGHDKWFPWECLLSSSSRRRKLGNKAEGEKEKGEEEETQEEFLAEEEEERGPKWSAHKYRGSI